MLSRPKRIIVTIAIFVLVATAVCTLPFPSQIDLKMTGSEVTQDGTAIADCTIRLSGWKHNYLFRKDTIKIDVQINNLPDLTFASTHHASLFTDASTQWDYGAWPIYLSESNQMDSLSLYLSKDLTWSVIMVDDRLYVVSTDPDADLQEYWKICPI